MPRGDGTGPGGVGAGKGKRMGTCGLGNQSNMRKGIGQVNSTNVNGIQGKEINKKQGQGKNRGNANLENKD